jgi:transcriptional regulator with XRE-family HTH domain
MAVGQRLRKERNTLGLTLKDVADKVGIVPSYLSHIENGRMRPNYETLEMIAKQLSLNTRELIQEEGYFSSEEYKSEYRSLVQIKNVDLSLWEMTLQDAQKAHQGGAALGSREILEPQFEAINSKIRGSYKTCTQDKLEEAVRLLSEVFVNLSFDYNVLLTRADLIRQSAPHRQRVEEILTLVPAAVDPMAQASFDYGIAETYHVLQEHELAIAMHGKSLLSQTIHYEGLPNGWSS